MFFRRLFAVRLDIFDGAAPAAPAADGGAQGDTTAVPGATRRVKTGEFQNVKFGKQEDASAAGTQQPSDAGSDKPDAKKASETLEARRKAYQELVSGEYKDLYTEDTQRIINKRFADVKPMQERLDKLQPLVDRLAQRYGITGDDPAKLEAAIDGDDSLWAEAAENAGMSVEQYKQLQQLRRDNARLMREQQRIQGQTAAQRQMEKWNGEAAALKAQFPSFDLNTEAQNPQFLAMLRSGVPVEHAYKVLHMDDIVSDTVRTTAAATEKAVVDNVRAKGARPAENGTGSQSAFTIADDVSKLSRRERAEVVRRAMRGETIKF